jgi:cytochrome b561
VRQEGEADEGAQRSGWSVATIALHWLSAVLILALLGLGWYMVHGDLPASTKFDLYQLHKSLGFLSLALLLFRLIARFSRPAPPPPSAMPVAERRLAAGAHIAFYVLLLLAGASGWLLVSTAIIPIPTRFFDLFVIPNLTGPDTEWFNAMTLAHYAASRLLIGLLILHIAAAFKHHFHDRDNVLTRMLPWPSR